jgi:hypothetical protein
MPETEVKKVEVCDSCREAFAEEGAGDFIEEVLFMGADIADHCCDAVESDGEIPCSCPCKRS